MQYITFQHRYNATESSVADCRENAIGDLLLHLQQSLLLTVESRIAQPSVRTWHKHSTSTWQRQIYGTYGKNLPLII